MSKLQILLGCDPEMWVRNIKTGRFVSAHDLIPGTKLKPHPVDNGAIQVDGVAAEFNITPARSVTEFTGNISAVMTQLQSYVGKDYELVSDPAVTFPEEYFKSLPEDVRELGCNPDFNAWTGQVNDKPDGAVTTMRTAAGHIHVGWCNNQDPTDSTHFDDCRIIARNLDYYLGLYSLQWDSDTSRRKLYGKAGSFRPKPYGMEYRPLSNVWLKSPKLQAWVYNAAVFATTNLITTGTRLEDTFGDIARTFIDNSESWWMPDDAKKSSDHKKLSKLPQMTGMSPPPPLPKPLTPEEKKIVVKPEAKFIYGSKDRGKKSMVTSSGSLGYVSGLTNPASLISSDPAWITSNVTFDNY